MDYCDIDSPGLYRNVFYTVGEAARLLGVSERTVFRWLRKNQLRRTKICGTLRIYGSDIADYLGIPVESVPVKNGFQ